MNSDVPNCRHIAVFISTNRNKQNGIRNTFLIHKNTNIYTPFNTHIYYLKTTFMVHRNALCPHKIQDICIFQIVNKIRINKGQMGYEMETSELLSLSLFCITSKNT